MTDRTLFCGPSRLLYLVQTEAVVLISSQVKRKGLRQRSVQTVPLSQPPTTGAPSAPPPPEGAAHDD